MFARLVTVALIASGLCAPALAEPTRRAAPKPQPERDRLIACPEYGPGFFRSPGSETCLRLSGQVRGEFGVRDRRSRAAPETRLSSEARLMLDARTRTDYGVVRLVVRPRIGL